ncbi:MAG: hypothetical protein WCS03_15790, partial [Bacteroidota bacterium]
MIRLKILILLFLTLFEAVVSGQVRVRLYSLQAPSSAVFSVTRGKYEVNTFNGETLIVSEGEPVIFSRFNGKLVVKIRNVKGFVCDSVIITGKSGEDSFSLRINGKSPVRQFYSGDLQCFPDLGTLV